MKFIQPNEDSLFIVGCDQEIKTGHSQYVYLINEDVFNQVQKFVELFKPTIDGWLNRHDKPGTTYYWEENYHDKICAMLHTMMPEVSYRDISSCLCALDM